MNKYFIQLFKEESTVILPEFGALTMTSEKTGEIMFMPYLKFDDGKLAKYIAKTDGIEEQDAKNMIAKFIREIQTELDQGNSFDIFGFGSFFKNKEGEVEFQADIKSLDELPAEPTKKEKKKDKSKPAVEVKEEKKEAQPEPVKEEIQEPAETAVAEDETKEAVEAPKDEVSSDVEDEKIEEPSEKKKDKKKEKNKDKKKKKKDKDSAKDSKDLIAALLEEEDEIEEASEEVAEEIVTEKEPEIDTQEIKEEASVTEETQPEAPVIEETKEVEPKADPKQEDSSNVEPIAAMVPDEEELGERPPLTKKEQKALNKKAKQQDKAEAKAAKIKAKQEAKAKKAEAKAAKKNKKAVTPEVELDAEAKPKKKRGLAFWLLIVLLLGIAGGAIWVAMNFDEVKKHVPFLHEEKSQEPKESQLEEMKEIMGEDSGDNKSGDSKSKSTEQENKSTGQEEDSKSKSSKQEDASKSESSEQEEDSKSSEQEKVAAGQAYHVIVGSLSDQKAANDFVKELKAKGFKAEVAGTSGGRVRVSAGRCANRDEAMKLLEKAKSIQAGAWLMKI